MPKPAVPSRAEQEAWQRANHWDGICDWWCLHAPRGPHLVARHQIESWRAEVEAGMPEAERVAIVSTYIDQKTAEIEAKMLPDAAALAAREHGGQKPLRFRPNTCECILWTVHEKPPAAPGPTDWLQTERTCPVHGAQSGDGLWRAVRVENQTRSRVLQIMEVKLAIPFSEIESHPTFRVSFAAQSGVDGRQVIVAGLTGGGRNVVKAACDAEFGPDVVDIE